VPRSLINILGPLVIVGALVSLPVGLAILGVIGFDEDLLFFILAEVMLLSGLLVVTMRDIIRCGLAMIVCFLALAGLYVTLGAPMVAAAQVIVYIGAISVLILFAIMLTADKTAPGKLTFQTQAAPAAVASIILAVLVAVAVAGTDWGAASAHVRIATDALARILFQDFVLAFEAVSVLLLAAVVGAVFLAKREQGS